MFGQLVLPLAAVLVTGSQSPAGHASVQTPAAQAPASTQAPAAPATEPVSEGAALSGAELNDLAGGFQDAVSLQNLSAVNTRNSITAGSVGSGAVNIGVDAFSGFHGIGNFVMNTGHNNNVQGSLSVTIVTTPQ